MTIKNSEAASSPDRSLSQYIQKMRVDPMLSAAIDQLTEREQHILVKCRLTGDPPTLEHLSHPYGISAERVRQIEIRAF
jgi:DNA-directed RNA polymerase sigma subunit (sigma70/sigma32)